MTDDNLYDLFIQNGYTPFEHTIYTNKKVRCLDKDGYIVYPTLRNIRENKMPLRFHNYNPDTINNIKHYIEINNITTTLESDVYVDSKQLLDFRCECGNLFKVSWDQFKSSKRYKCEECEPKRFKRIVPYNIVVEKLNNNNLIPLFSQDEYVGVCGGDYTIQNDCGYKAKFKTWFIEKICVPEWFHKCNPYTIENINLYLKNTMNDEYVCISEEYINQYEDLDILHKPCGTVFQAKWVNLYRKANDKEPNRHGTQCPHCTGLRQQSLHAVVLKQIFQKLKPGTVVEDPSCRNPLTGRILPTDIVNHNEKIAIEIQSWWHDKEHQQIKDKIKKEYWIKRGYKVYTPDIRDYTVIDMVRLFFSDINQIPEWVDYCFESKLNVDIAQELLNKGLIVTEVAEEMGVIPHRIYDAIQHKRLYYPKNYPNINLTKQNDYINQQVTVQTAGCV